MIFFNQKQFGFQTNKLSTDAVLWLILDLAESFNSILHEMFLKKAESFNFSSPAFFYFLAMEIIAPNVLTYF